MARLRGLLASRGLAAYVVPTADAHNSEYVSARDKRRAFLTGFTGSAGTAVVTPSEALLWTDGRYHLQASTQLSDEWTLMKAGLADTPTIDKWLSDNVEATAGAVGIDPHLFTIADARRMRTALDPKSVRLSVVTPNLVDEVWGTEAGQPDPPSGPVAVHDEAKYAGRSFKSKLEDVRAELAKRRAAALCVTALDEVAWLFNIRGSDIAFNPVVIAYGVVTRDEALLFVDDAKVTPAVRDHLGDAVQIMPYAAVTEWLAAYSQSDKAGGRHIWMDPQSCSVAFYCAVEAAAGDENAAGKTVAKRVLSEASPVALAKALKNPVELEGMRQAHLRDAVAVVNFLSWLEAEVRKGGEAAAALTEYTVSERLAAFRAEQDSFVGLSFETIAGCGANGAIIHYKPEEATAATVDADHVFLCDSGGQYLDGTTDITRTVHMGEPTAHERACFTRVLQGHIAIATAVFPEGTTGHSIDSFARAALWKAGLDFMHGTGHGVGAYLNVHEGPQGIGLRPRPYTGGFREGMTMTDEPGYYEEGAFGIRIESVLVVSKAETEHQFGGRQFLGFTNITLVPIQTKMVDAALLSDDELRWLNDYNAMCLEQVAPLVTGDALAYLTRECAALTR